MGIMDGLMVGLEWSVRAKARSSMKGVCVLMYVLCREKSREMSYL